MKRKGRDDNMAAADPISFARSYQVEALEKAIKENTIVYLETGSGKTLIAIMLLRSYAHHLRKPSPFIAVFMVPTVVLVAQQAGAVEMHTNLNVGKYWGEMGVDYWDALTWKKELHKYEVLVMTPRILLDALRHGFLKLDIMKLLIFDECHNARGKSDYACILKEFYHPCLRSASIHLPRIFGMTASLVKSKGSNSSSVYGKHILDLESLMNSKVFTVANEAALAKYIPFSNTKLKLYEDIEIQCSFFSAELRRLKMKHEQDLDKLKLENTADNSFKKKISKLWSIYMYCAEVLGIWLAYKAAETLSCSETVIYFWGLRNDGIGEGIMRKFSEDVLQIFLPYIPSVTCPNWRIGDDIHSNLHAGLLSAKVICLIESLAEYRDIKDLRCIVFVERVITAIVLQSLLSEVSVLSGWNTVYMAGNQSGLQSQSRKEQISLVDAFRNGTVNIIVATQILEEGLDVQSCNLVIRFDPAATVCSFIQSRGRARMEGSDYVLIVKSGDTSTLSRVNQYLVSGDFMREESLRHAAIPCAPLERERYEEDFYRVETTGAIATLNSSVDLIYYYCSQLPSDRYYRPAPRFIIDKEAQFCTLYLPKSCPIQMVRRQGPKDILKKLVCLEACRKLHEIGALTDNLLPEIVFEEADTHHFGDLSYDYNDQVIYFPRELVSNGQSDVEELFHCYLIVIRQNFTYDFSFRNMILLMKASLEYDIKDLDFELVLSRGSANVNLVYSGTVNLNPELVLISKRFQVTVLRILIHRSLNNLLDAKLEHKDNHSRVDYLILPASDSDQNNSLIDWDCVRSLSFSSESVHSNNNALHNNCRCDSVANVQYIHTENRVVCRCMLVNSVVFTPHNGYMYCITGVLDEMNGNSCLKGDDFLTYKKYYHSRHGINLEHDGESLLCGRHIFTVQNWLQRRKYSNDTLCLEPSNAWVELPPELCRIIMSPVSVSTFYSYSLVPSIMHRVESILLALNLKKLISDHSAKNVNVSTMKVVEAITTKKCLEEFSLESLETLGDSFLKYAASQYLFRTMTYHHEGLLSARKEKMVSNDSLCKLGCDRKLQGFIRHECFDPKKWTIPGDTTSSTLDEVSVCMWERIYVTGTRPIKSKIVADVVEGLIGAYLISGGEMEALLFMDWLGLKIDFVPEVLNERPFFVHAERHVDVKGLESLLNYTFCNPSLLVEALTHGSYQVLDIPQCYQRLEFLGDAVLDHLITIYFYTKYPGLSPGDLTELRSSSVNNDCYAHAAVKAGLHRHILHASLELHKQMQFFVDSSQQYTLHGTFGWESETTVPKVLGDIIESLAGAIFVDSGCRKDVVWECIRPLLEPLVTLDTLRLHPIMELNELCQQNKYKNSTSESFTDGVAFVTVEVEANGRSYRHTCTGSNKKTAEKLAAKVVLQTLKANMVE